MTLRRTHDCVRCGRAISPGDEFAAVDVLDPDGELRVLLCVACGAELRAFLAGNAPDGAVGDTEDGAVGGTEDGGLDGTEDGANGE